MKILATLSTEPGKRLESAFIHDGVGQWPAPLPTTTRWCFLPGFYPLKPKPMKNKRQCEPSQNLQPCNCFISPGAALGEANRPRGFSPSLLEEKGWLGGGSDDLTQTLLFVLSPPPSQWSPLQSQWLPGAKPRCKSRLAHSSLLW